MRQASARLAALPTIATYSIEGDDLWLRDAGATLVHHVAVPDCPHGSQRVAASFSKRILHIAYSSGTSMG